MMGNESGKMSKDLLIILDYDGTLVFGDGTHEDFDLLRDLRDSATELTIASRNDKYRLDRALVNLGIDDLFTYVMADFRPKSYQARHILMLYSNRGVTFSKTVFVDDHHSNIERMRLDVPEIQSLRYGEDICSLADLHVIIHK